MTDGADLDLVRHELQQLVDEVTLPDPAAPFGAYIWSSSEPGAELGRYLEREVFAEFFGNSPEMLADEYGPYDDASSFFCVVDHRRSLPAGVLRVLSPSAAGFKSLHDIERVWSQPLEDVTARTGVEFEPTRMWDVATLAVHAEYRGAATSGLVSLALYQALVTASLQCGVDWWVTVLDVVVLDLIQSQCQSPFSYFRGLGPMSYLDSPSSVPVWCDVPGWERRIAEVDPPMHELLCEGRGLEAAVTRAYADQLDGLGAGVLTGGRPSSPARRAR